MSKPSEFFVGVLDFFAILLPGAIATAILAPRIGHLILGPLVATPTSDAGRWAVFVTSSYFLGHLIFLVGSYLDGLYDVARRKLNPYDDGTPYECATRIHDGLLTEESERKALNTFQWTRSVLLAKAPTAAEDVHRLEADSKFFRSLLVVCGLSAIAFLSRAQVVEGIVALVLVPLCFARYYERRLKSTTQAYIHLITLHRLGGLAPAAKPTDA